MRTMPTNYLVRIGFWVVLVAALTVFIPAAVAQNTEKQHTEQIQTSSGRVDLDRLANYIGQEVTLRGDIDKIFGDTAFQMEAKDQTKAHILVINVIPESVHPEGEMKEGQPVTATGHIRKFDPDAMKQDYVGIDFGSAPVDSFYGKPVLVMGEREFEAALQPKAAPVQQAQVEREKPSIPAPEPQATKPEPQRTTPETSATTTETLPRTASPLPLVGLAGLLSVATGLCARLLRRA